MAVLAESNVASRIRPKISGGPDRFMPGSFLFVAKLLLAERRRRGTSHGSRALSCFRDDSLGDLVTDVSNLIKEE